MGTGGEKRATGAPAVVGGAGDFGPGRGGEAALCCSRRLQLQSVSQSQTHKLSQCLHYQVIAITQQPSSRPPTPGLCPPRPLLAVWALGRFSPSCQSDGRDL